MPGVNTAGNQNTTGSAATLTTARTIGGVAFDGSANINLPGVNTTGNQNTTGSAATLTTARTIAGTSFDGSANIDISYNNLTDLPSGNTDGKSYAVDYATFGTVSLTGSTATTITIGHDSDGNVTNNTVDVFYVRSSKTLYVGEFSVAQDSLILFGGGIQDAVGSTVDECIGIYEITTTLAPSGTAPYNIVFTRVASLDSSSEIPRFTNVYCRYGNFARSVSAIVRPSSFTLGTTDLTCNVIRSEHGWFDTTILTGSYSNYTASAGEFILIDDGWTSSSLTITTPNNLPLGSSFRVFRADTSTNTVYINTASNDSAFVFNQDTVRTFELAYLQSVELTLVKNNTNTSSGIADYEQWQVNYLANTPLPLDLTTTSSGNLGLDIADNSVLQYKAAASGGQGGFQDVLFPPPLSAHLDVATYDIVSTSNRPIELAPHGTGKVTIKGNAGGSGQLVLNCENNSHGVTIKGPPHSAGANYTLTLPDTDGSANEVLKTDGSGNLAWVAQSSGGSTTFSALTDTTISSPGADQVVLWDNTNSVWVNGQLDYSQLTGTPTVPTTLTSLTNVSAISPSNGDVLSYSSSNSRWEASQSSGGISDLSEDSTPELGGDLECLDNSVKFGGSSAPGWAEIKATTIGSVNGLTFSIDSSVLGGSSDNYPEPAYIFESSSTSNNSTGPQIMLFNKKNIPAGGELAILDFKNNLGSGTTDYLFSRFGSRKQTSSNAAGDRTADFFFEVFSDGTKVEALKIAGSTSDQNVVTTVTKILDVAEHNGLVDPDNIYPNWNGATGLKLGGTLVTATAAELNKLDGVTATTAELNVIDGDTSATSTTLVDADRVVVNDAGTMKQVALTDVMTYINSKASLSYSAITAGTTTAAANTHYSVNTSGGQVNINLPQLSTVADGTEIRVKVRDATNNTVITGYNSGTEKIDNSGTLTLAVQYQAVTLVAGSVEWEVI